MRFAFEIFCLLTTTFSLVKVLEERKVQRPILDESIFAEKKPSAFESGGGCLVDPAILTAFEESHDSSTKLTVIVTFKSKPDLLKHARNAEFLMDYFQKEFLPNLEEISLGNKKFSDWLHKNQNFFSKAKKNAVNVKSFKKSYLGNVVKGYYVYQTMKKASNLIEVC